MSKRASKKGVLRVTPGSSDGAGVNAVSTSVALEDTPLSIPETPPLANDRQITAADFRGKPHQITRWWAECILAVILISSALLALVWVFKVPILQNPDENSHVDYAFSIYSAGRLLNVRKPPSGWNVHARAGALPEAAWERISHQYTLYLADSTDFQRIRFHPEEKVSPDYGTAAYYQRLDRKAPHSPAKLPHLQPQDNPWLVTGYPFGYYALVAVWLGILAKFTGSVVSLFFGARILSVVLFACSLFLTYATTRELHLSKARSLALTAIVGFSPLSTFVSSSIQPDNLSLLLVLLCFYCGLLLRRARGDRLWLLAFLGCALGALGVTKYHFFLLTLLSVLGMLVSEHIFQRKPGAALVRKLAILLLPSMVFLGTQLWIGWGGGVANNLRHTTVGLLTGIQNAVTNYYGGGASFASWWGIFGWMDTPLIIGSLNTQRGITLLMLTLTLAIVALTLLRLEQVITRLISLARRGRRRRAARIAFSNPLINSHFVFVIFMILLYALSDNTFIAQGRHWFPYILCSLLITTQYAPRALSHRKTRVLFSALMALGLAAYCAIGSYYSIQAIKERYYGTRPTTNAITGETSQ